MRVPCADLLGAASKSCLHCDLNYKNRYKMLNSVVVFLCFQALSRRRLIPVRIPSVNKVKLMFLWNFAKSALKSGIKPLSESENLKSLLFLFRCLSTSFSRWSIWKSGGKSQNIAQNSHGTVWSWGKSIKGYAGGRTGGGKEEGNGKETEEGKGKTTTAETGNGFQAVWRSR